MVHDVLGLQRPVCTIDFEASSVDECGYPIEVGIEVWPAPNEPIVGWSTLISPTEEWREFGCWGDEAAMVHGITPEQVEGGALPHMAAAELNARLGRGLVWCDGGAFDQHWLGELFEAANMQPTFTLRDWHVFLQGIPPDARTTALKLAESSPRTHRARADAEVLLHILSCGSQKGGT